MHRIRFAFRLPLSCLDSTRFDARFDTYILQYFDTLVEVVSSLQLGPPTVNVQSKTNQFHPPNMCQANSREYKELLAGPQTNDRCFEFDKGSGYVPYCRGRQ